MKRYILFGITDHSQSAGLKNDEINRTKTSPVQQQQ